MHIQFISASVDFKDIVLIVRVVYHIIMKSYKYFFPFISFIILIASCKVPAEKRPASLADDFPLSIKQETKKPPEDIPTINYPEPPGSLSFEDRHLVAKPFNEIYAYDFYSGSLEQPVWAKSVLKKLSAMLVQKKLNNLLLSASFPDGLVSMFSRAVENIETVEEIRFASLPSTKPQFLVLDFAIITKNKRIPGECILDMESEKLLHIAIAPFDAHVDRGLKEQINPLEILQELGQ